MSVDSAQERDERSNDTPLKRAIALHDAIASYLRPFVGDIYDADEMADDITKLPELMAYVESLNARPA